MSDFFSFVIDQNIPKIKQKKWMKSKVMELATVETLPSIIDACIKSGRVGWDLETTGLNKHTFTTYEEGRTQDQIVGHCLSPDKDHGYYIPIRHRKGKQHNLPLSFVHEQLRRLLENKVKTIFHNNWFDATFLQWNGGEPLGTWDDPDLWEDIWILAYLDNSKSESEKISLGLKALSERHLGYKQIELRDLFPKDFTGKIDFAELDPSWEPCLWYAASDAICTLEVFDVLYPRVIRPNGHLGLGQSIVYKIEKLCSPATRWIERVGCPIDRNRVAELIRIGQKEYYNSIKEVYEFCKDIVGRDIEPDWFKLFQKNLDLENVEFNINEQIRTAKQMASRMTYGKPGTLKKIIGGQEKEFPKKYDVLSRQQLGPLFEEMEIPDLKRTERSNQIQTTQGEIERLNEKFGEQYPFLPKISRMGELQKALGTYLFSLYNDLGPDGRLHCKIKQLGTDTGRFTTPGPGRQIKNLKEIGGTRYPLHGTPARKDEKKPECLKRIRECFSPRNIWKGTSWEQAAIEHEKRIEKAKKAIVAIDYASVELRIVTNMSREPKWLKEYFRCSQCEHEFDPNEVPPTICPNCGSDKIGDLHTLTAIAFYGESKIGTKEWKKLRNGSKGANFAAVYGGGPAALQRSTGCDEATAAYQYRVFTQTYDVLQAWQKKVIQYGQKHEFVTSAFGRHYPLPNINLPTSPQKEPNYDQRRLNKKIVSGDKRNAVNAPVQMSSADITKLAMGLIYQEVKKRGWFGKVNMIITLHDELVFEVDFDILPEFLSWAPTLMAQNKAIQGLEWPVPLICDTEMGFDWTVPYNLIDWQNGLVREDGVVLDWKGRPTKKKWPMEFVRVLAPTYGVRKIEETPEVLEIHLNRLDNQVVEFVANFLTEHESENGTTIKFFSPSGNFLYESSTKIDSIGFQWDLKEAGLVKEK